MKFSINLVEVVSGDKGTIYSIHHNGAKVDELEQTLASLKIVEQNTYNIIIALLARMTDIKGFEECHFSFNVGKHSDQVCRLDISGSDFRLYCIRFNKSLIIIGGGGIKLTRTYQETEATDQAVKVLQAIDKLINDRLNSGVIKIIQNSIIGNKNFEFEIEV